LAAFAHLEFDEVAAAEFSTSTEPTNMFKRALVTLLLFAATLAATAGSSVWKVSSDDSYIYIGGTCHLLRESDFPLPEEFNRAYGDSQSVVFETDIGKMKDPSVQQMFMSKGALRGKTLDGVLSPKVYQELSDQWAKSGIPLAALNGFKPSMVVLMISMAELQKIGITQDGVDVWFYEKGKKDGKEIKQLETIEEQVDFIFAMGEGNEDEFVSRSIKDLKDVKETMTKVLDAWKKGDRAALAGEFVEEMKRDYPQLYKALLVDRNKKWLPKVEAYFKTEKREFVLVGVGHLVGADGVLAALEKKGYRVEQLDSK
jgi:uncharacterized protein YbaP (TraB family)